MYFSPDNIYDNGLIDTVTNGISQSISLPDGQQPQICSVTPNIRIGRKQQLEENKQTTNINKNMKKQTIKLNESQLRGLIKESIKKVLNENADSFEQTFAKPLRDIKIAASRKENFSKVITCPEWSEPDIDMAFRITFEWKQDFEVYYCTIYHIQHGKVSNAEISNFNTHGFGGAATAQGYVGSANALVRIITQIFREWWHGDMSDDELNREYDSNDSWHYSQEEY